MKNFDEWRKWKLVRASRLLIAVLFGIQLLFALNVSGQQVVRVSGTVTDQTGQPLPGVTVVEEGTTNGTVTNADGVYTITVPGKAALAFSFVGMKTQKVAVNSQSRIDIKFEEESIGLEEVVAIGYGTQKKVNLTGSVSAIEGDNLIKQSAPNVSTALQGLIPGLIVTRSEGGEPGMSSTLRIRGGGLAADNPLVIVDGIPSTIDNVNSNDIESISVLKDGASAAIYGSRAAGGVILITTKRAAKGFSVSYNGKLSMQKPTILPEYVDGYEYMVMNNLANKNQGTTQLYSDSYLQEYLINNKTNSDVYPNTDWNKVMYHNALQQDHFINISGGNDRINVLGSIGYLSQDGIMDNSDFQRYTFRLNSSMKVSKSFEFNVDVEGGRKNTTASSYDAQTAARDIQITPPIYAPKYSDGRWGTSSNGKNPKAQIMDAGTTTGKVDHFNLNILSIFSPAKGLTFSLNAAPSLSYSYKDAFIKPVKQYFYDSQDVAFIRPAGVTFSELTSSFSDSFTLLLKALGQYDFKINENHHFLALLGFEQIQNKSISLSGFRDNFVLEEYQVIDAGSTSNMKSTGNNTEWSLQSYFSRFNYDYLGKFLFEANVRYDGSSRLAPGRKWDVFPSFSLGWRTSEEKFMQTVDFISNLKLRASWGLLGNQNIGLYPYVSSINLNQFAILGNQRVDGASLTDIANAEITWEISEMKNIGIDLSVLDNKLDISADFFIKDSRDILLTLPVPLTLGLKAPVQNAGKSRNKGYEITVSFRDKIKDLNYSVRANFSDIANEVTDLKGTGPYISGNTIDQEGYPLDSYNILEAERLFQENDNIAEYPTQYGTIAAGDIKYKDISGSEGKPDGKIDSYDRKIFPNNYVRYSYGLDFGAEYKGFDFGVFFQGVFGIEKLLTSGAVVPFLEFATPQKWMRDYWTPENSDAKYPRLMISSSNNQQVSSFYLRDASYLRLKNIQFGYTLSNSALQKLSIKSLRMFVSGQDILTIHNFFSGWDPESSSTNGSFYPFVSSYTFGINLKF